jgi:hypothetical protein
MARETHRLLKQVEGHIVVDRSLAVAEQLVLLKKELAALQPYGDVEQMKQDDTANRFEQTAGDRSTSSHRTPTHPLLGCLFRLNALTFVFHFLGGSPGLLVWVKDRL